MSVVVEAQQRFADQVFPRRGLKVPKECLKEEEFRLFFVLVV
jgi:hypothetical protein